MTFERELAQAVALAVKSATAPLLERIAVLEARAPVPGPAGERGERGSDGLNGKDGASGLSIKGEPGERGLPGLHGVDGVPGARGEKGADGLQGKDGAPGLHGKDGASGQPGRDVDEALVKECRARLDDFVPLTARVANVEARLDVPDLDPDEVVASIDVLLRKELAILETAAPRRLQKRVIYNEHGKVDYVVEEAAP